MTDPQQIRDFFFSAMDQYDDVHDAAYSCTATLATGHSIWVEVTWDYLGQAPSEQFCYQLIGAEGSWRIGVLTAL